MYKQATRGACKDEMPDADPPKLAKWKAWREVSELAQNEAKVFYVRKIQECDPKWKPPSPHEDHEAFNQELCDDDSHTIDFGQMVSIVLAFGDFVSDVVWASKVWVHPHPYL